MHTLHNVIHSCRDHFLGNLFKSCGNGGFLAGPNLSDKITNNMESLESNLSKANNSMQINSCLESGQLKKKHIYSLLLYLRHVFKKINSDRSHELGSLL